MEETAQESTTASMPFSIVLASASPRRHDLLEAANIPHTILAMDVDETLEPDLAADPEKAVKKLAERKAGAAVNALLEGDLVGICMVIGADTMVVKGRQVFGKPKDAPKAMYMLNCLSGTTHQVMTGVSIWMIMVPPDDPDNVSIGFRSFTDISDVTFRKLTDSQIIEYVESGEPFGKAGGYAIQGAAGAFVKSVRGDMDTVIGLPVQRLLREFPELAQLSEQG